MKQSNWLLGIGIFVAILLIVGSIWMSINMQEPANAVNNTPNTKIGQSINNTINIPLRTLSGIIKQVY